MVIFLVFIPKGRISVLGYKTVVAINDIYSPSLFVEIVLSDLVIKTGRFYHTEAPNGNSVNI